MKRIFLSIFLFSAVISSALAQEISYGLKGGVNYTMGGSITGISSNGLYTDDTFEAEGKLGFHGGAFVQVNFGKFFVRPEIVYTTLESQYNFPVQPSIYSVEKLDVPLLFGYNVFGPLDLYAGPVFSNIMSSTLQGEEILESISAQNTPVHAQAGAKVEFGRFGIDVRYEHNMSTKTTQELDIVNDDYGINRATFDDARLNQIIVSVIFKIGGPGLNERRRRPCY
ncbi:MAG TPA: outer membrane beta-barrel protein [Salinimicrobium sp.]|nr:outer membrane beta-barrel protein [Salinimicrobium sp.]